MNDEAQQDGQAQPQANPPITLVFALSDLNAVLELLRKYPMEQVEPIVQAIRQQAIPQLNALNKQGEE